MSPACWSAGPGRAGARGAPGRVGGRLRPRRARCSAAVGPAGGRLGASELGEHLRPRVGRRRLAQRAIQVVRGRCGRPPRQRRARRPAQQLDDRSVAVRGRLQQMRAHALLLPAGLAQQHRRAPVHPAALARRQPGMDGGAQQRVREPDRVARRAGGPPATSSSLARSAAPTATAASAAASDSGASSSTATAKASACASAVSVPEPAQDRSRRATARRLAVAAVERAGVRAPSLLRERGEQLADLRAGCRRSARSTAGRSASSASRPPAADERVDGRGPERRRATATRSAGSAARGVEQPARAPARQPGPRGRSRSGSSEMRPTR